MCSHWFSASQWQLPNREQYEKLQALFAEHAGKLERSHDELTKEYDALAGAHSYCEQSRG